MTHKCVQMPADINIQFDLSKGVYKLGEYNINHCPYCGVWLHSHLGSLVYLPGFVWHGLVNRATQYPNLFTLQVVDDEVVSIIVSSAGITFKEVIQHGAQM